MTPSHRATSRFVAFVVIALLLFAALAAADVQPERVVVIGDIHGDAQQLQVALIMSDVIDKSTRQWSAGNTTRLVMMGDLVDRGHEDKETLDFVMQLQKDARAAGSDVVIVLGNHEIMNLQGQIHYVSKQSIESFGGRHGHREAYSEAGIYGQWIRTFPLTYVHWNTLFCHAGLLPEFARRGLETIEATAKKEIESFSAGNSRQAGDEDVLGVHGPVWTRKVVHRASSGDCRLVRETLDVLKLDRMVVGHTPQYEGSLGEFCDGKLIVVDVGISRWMYGNMAVLEMTKNADGEVELREIKPRLPGTEAPVEEAPSDKATPEDSAPADTSSDPVTAELQRDPLRLQEIFETMRQAERWEKKEDLW